MLTCNVLATGSRGNCVLLNDIIAFDMGVPYKMIAPYVRNLRLVLLSHIHGDHFNPATIRRIAEERPSLRWVCGEWLVQPLLDAGVDKYRIDVLDTETCNGYDNMSVIVGRFDLVHDVENCGWTVTLDNGGRKETALYATDTATMDGVTAKDLDLYMIEANYIESELEQRKRDKLAAGEFSYEDRAAASHLSREQAQAWLAENATPGKSRVVYLHEHNPRKDARPNG